MPAGNPPSNQLTLYQVDSIGIGSFGPTFRDISRLGLNEIRYVVGANRGEVTTVRCLHYTIDEQSAIEHLGKVKDLQGTEINLISESTDKDWDVFLRRSRGYYRPVGSTDPNKNYLITYQLEIQRTK